MMIWRTPLVAIGVAMALVAAEAPPPIKMCILIDNSGGMRNKRNDARVAALTVVEASRPGDKVCILNFNDEVSSGLPHDKDFTSDVKEMEQSLSQIDARGGKALRDAVAKSLDRLAESPGNERRVLVLIAGGSDNSSTITQDQLLARVKTSGVNIYAIGLWSEDGAAARLALSQLAKASGGLDYYAGDIAEVQKVSAGIADAVYHK
jgi:VWFA-related protein